MENQTKTTIDTQGVEVEEKKERNPSASYTIKSLAGNIKKIEQLKLANKEDLKTLKELHAKIVKQYIGYELGL